MPEPEFKIGLNVSDLREQRDSTLAMLDDLEARMRSDLEICTDPQCKEHLVRSLELLLQRREESASNYETFFAKFDAL